MRADLSMTEAANGRLRALWLFSPARDLAIVGLPIVATLAAVVLARLIGVQGIVARSYAAWGSQFVLGNSTHVILTFLLVATRRDVLNATKRQASTIVFGSLGTLLATTVGFGLSEAYLPTGKAFVLAVALVFATHHALAQVKGFWALYNLRGGRSGLAAPTARERWLQQHWVAIALLFVMTKWLFVANLPGAAFAYVQAIPAMPAPLPFGVSYVLLGAWCVYGALVARELWTAPAQGGPKVLYLAVHFGTVALMLVLPGWGAILASAIHGCEYFVLCGKVLEPTEVDVRSRLTKQMVWPAMLAAATPLFIVGLVNAPFAAALFSSRVLSVSGMLGVLLNGVVMAHYFADAFLYRFRVPEIRRVTLARLGFA